MTTTNDQSRPTVTIQHTPGPPVTRVRRMKGSSSERVQLKVDQIESYTRHDIPCGSGRCTSLQCSPPQCSPPSIRSELVRYLFPSAEVLSAFLDVFESNDVAESEALVVLQSEASRIGRGKTRLLSRIRRLVRSNKRRSVVLFDDVHHADVDAKDVRGVAAWYEHHVGHEIECVPLGNIAAVDAYFHAVWPRDSAPWNLYESQRELRASSFGVQDREDERGNEAGTWVDRRWGDEDVERGIEEGRLVKGRLEVDIRQSRELAWVVVGGERVAMVVGKKDRWHAMHGDVVVVEMLAEGGGYAGDEHGGETGSGTGEEGKGAEDVEVDEEQSSGLVEQLADDVPSRTYNNMDTRRARVVHVPGEQQRPDVIVSISPDDVETAEAKKTSSVLCVPFDYRFPKMRLRSAYLGNYVGKRLLVRVIGWKDDDLFPHVHVIKALGEMGDVETEISCILNRHGIDHDDFSRIALADLPEASYRVEDEVATALESGDRADFRSRFVVSIDPPGCTDVDDAFHVRLLDDATGAFELGIHIADVTHYLLPNTPLDEEALFRSTTVYLVDRRLNMLPARISEDVASLLCERPRFAVSVVWTGKRSGNSLTLGQPQFHRSIIESRYQLTYANAQAILDGSANLAVCGMKSASDLAEMRTALELVQSLAWNRLSTRLADGAIELDSKELRFDLDADGLPTSLHEKQTIDSMKIIAELMILANEAVATQLHRTFPRDALLRCHAAPDARKLERIREFSRELSDRIALATTEKDVFVDVHRFGADLRSVRRAIPGNAVPLLQMTANRCLSEARYVRAASTPSSRHFGLAIDLYTHFTSPIRRYADVIVHRQLLASMALESSRPTSYPALQEHMVDTMNERNRASKLAQRECTLLYLLLYLATSPQTAQAIVQDVDNDGSLHVYVPRYELKGKIEHDQRTTSIARLDKVCVRLEARTSSSHGPTLLMSLVDGDTVDLSDKFDQHVELLKTHESLVSAEKTPGFIKRSTSGDGQPTIPDSLEANKLVSLLQSLSLTHPAPTHYQTSLPPVDPHPLPEKLPAALRDAITRLLAKSRTYQQRALRARCDADHWLRLANDASIHASTILKYHYGDNTWNSVL